MSENITSVADGLRKNARIGHPKFTAAMADVFSKLLDACESGDESAIHESGDALGCDLSIRESAPSWVYGPWHLANAVLAEQRGDMKAYQAHLGCAKAYMA